jgi:transcriptional regulator with XRE-family HTH domain
LDQEIGRLIRDIREAQGLSIASLARQVAFSQSHLRSVENGNRAATADLVTACDRALGTGGLLAARIAGRESSREASELSTAVPPVRYSQEDDQDYEDIMRRRAFLLNLAILTELGRSSPAAAIEIARRELSRSFPDLPEHDADSWNQIALEYGYAYPVTDPAELLGSLLVDFSGIQESFERYPGETHQRELYRACALLAGFCAQTASNLGHLSESRRWWRTARHASERAGDSYTPLWVRCREIIHAMGVLPVGAVLRLAEDAGHFTAGAPPELVLEYLGCKAQTFAMPGRRAEAEEALRELRDFFSSSPFGGFSGSVLGWGEERLISTESFTYSRLGDDASAGSSEDAAWSMFKSEPANVRWPAAISLNKAYCLVGNGDIGTGLAHAHQAVSALPPAQRTNGILIHARDVLSAIPQQHRGTPQAGEYREWLAEAFTPTA